MRIEENLLVKSFTIYDAPKLDPITITLHDIAPNQGRLTIEVWGEAWSAYWGGMGSVSVAKFVCSCGPDYITGKLVRQKATKRDTEYLQRIVAATQEALRSLD